MGALDGIRVIDFGQYIAGPLAGMLLADQGADVVKVDPPGGPWFDSPANRTWNRGKRSIVLDLKFPQGIKDARALIGSADVVIENFRPGVMDRLGLGPEAMTAANPALVYCSLPGFAAADERAQLPAWEGVIGAATATYRPSAANPEGNPVYTAIPIASSYAAFVAVASIAMALNARERDGLGQRIEVPLYDAMFQAIGLYGMRFHDRPMPLRASPWVRQYECADGRWVQFHAANTRFIQQFVDAAGLSGWRNEGLTDRGRVATDPDLARELEHRMEALFKTRPAQEWEDLVNAAGTPTAVCRDSSEWMQHEHALGAEMMVDLDDPVLGRVRQPGLQVRLSATPGAVRGPAPLLDADRAAVLPRTTPRAARRPAGPEDLHAALEGVRVLDLCIILAGPACGRTLAEFGADVIKIDYPDREGGVAFHHDINRAKRSILLDLRRPAGMEVFWQLVEKTDVVLQNYRQGVVERLGIDYESVRTRRPDIVYASLNAYGDIGPWAARPGWEQLAQAATGMQKRFGGDGPAVLQPYAINDYGTGLMGAYGVALALLHRQKTGEGQHVQTALARTACTLQSQFMQEYEGKQWDEPRGQDALGWGPLHRLYRASDGWFFLALREDQHDRLAAAPGLEAVSNRASDALEPALERAFVQDTAEAWVERLRAVGVGAQRALSAEDVMADAYAVSRGLSLTREHDGVGLVTTNGPSPLLSRTPVVPGRPAPVPGADAVSVLADIGREDEIDALVAAGAIRLPETANPPA